MSFFFAWEQAPVLFDPILHARRDLDIVDLNLLHEEGKPALLKLKIPTQISLPFPAWGILSARLNGKIFCLFQGARLESPHLLEEELQEISLISYPPDADLQMATLLESHKTSDSFDPLLFSEAAASNPQIICLSKPVDFFWDPRTLHIRLSSLFEGVQKIDVTPWAFRDSLSFHWGHPPLSQVHVTLQAQWVQQAQGFMNLGSTIADLFPEKQINTLTGGAFKNFWPRTGQRLGQSGYWIAFSRLEEIKPPSPEVGRSKTILKRRVGGTPQDIFLKRQWFKGKILVGWRLHQKRIERLSFTLPHVFQKSVPLPEEKSTSTLTLNLQALCPHTPLDVWTPHTSYEAGDRIQENGQMYHCIAPHKSKSAFSKDASFWQDQGLCPGALPNPAASSFFLTQRGKKVVASAMQIASTFLAQRARAFCFSLSLPFEKAPLLSLEDQVSLTDPRLPCGRVTGKIVSSCLKVKGETGEACFTLKVKASLGLKSPPSQAPPTLLPYEDQGPQDPYAELESLRERPLLKKIALLHGPDEQERLLEEGATSLCPFPTRLCLHFKKLSSCEALVHHFYVSVSHPWSSPHQITLKEPFPC